METIQVTIGWGWSKSRWGMCENRPTKHLLRRMEERGWSQQEVLNATFRGSKEYKEDGYIGKSGPCEVVVKRIECNTIITVFE